MLLCVNIVFVLIIVFIGRFGIWFIFGKFMFIINVFKFKIVFICMIFFFLEGFNGIFFWLDVYFLLSLINFFLCLICYLIGVKLNFYL